MSFHPLGTATDQLQAGMTDKRWKVSVPEGVLNSRGISVSWKGNAGGSI